MIKKILYTSVFIVLISFCAFLPKPQVLQKQTIKKPREFASLIGWESSAMKPSFEAFQASCKTFLKLDPEKSVGTQLISLKVKDWQPVCRAALSFDAVSEQTAHHFFQAWFTPVEFNKKKPIQGKFTGYYMPSIEGSLTKSPQYSYPIYALPKDLKTRHQGRNGRKKLPYYTRAQIDKGAISKSAKVLAWVKSPVDRLFLEIEGAGAIRLENGQTMHLTYAGENGAHYQSIASILIKKGIMTKDNASYPHIKRYLEAHPKEMLQLMAANPSFVFFEVVKDKHAALGAQGVPLTSGYSLAVDRKFIPLGTPLWLETKHKNQALEPSKQPFKRLMIAQDTGGAIKGMVRGDIYLGTGNKAEKIAATLKTQGTYWLLLPRHTLSKLKTSMLRAGLS